MDLAQPVELFTSAVTALAQGPGAIQQRLNRAYMNALSQVHVAALPDDLRPGVEQMIANFGVTPITRTMMTDDAATALAGDVVTVAFELCRRSAAGGD
jgi:hypothetical protein